MKTTNMNIYAVTYLDLRKERSEMITNKVEREKWIL